MAKGGKKTRKTDQGEMESSKKKTSKVKTKSKHELAKVTSIPKAVARTLGITFSVGSVCSGLCTEVFALQSLLGDNFGVVDHTFACDSSPVAKEFARANFKYLFKKRALLRRPHLQEVLAECTRGRPVYSGLPMSTFLASRSQPRRSQCSRTSDLVHPTLFEACASSGSDAGERPRLEGSPPRDFACNLESDQRHQGRGRPALPSALDNP